MASSKRLYYIDMLLLPPDGILSSDPDSTISSKVMRKLKDDVRQAIDSATSNARLRPCITLIIDGLDFLLSAEPSSTSVDLSVWLLSLQTQLRHLIVSISADAPLLHQARTPLEEKHQCFTTVMAHQSSRLLQLRSLESGAARDISGVLRISNGGQHDIENDRDASEEHEYLYQTKSDGNVRIWSRGE